MFGAIVSKSFDSISSREILDRSAEDLSLYFHNRNPTLQSLRNQTKSDSLNSEQANVCCTKLAFNFYNKAIDSAKKRLPK